MTRWIVLVGASGGYRFRLPPPWIRVILGYCGRLGVTVSR